MSRYHGLHTFDLLVFSARNFSLLSFGEEAEVEEEVAAAVSERFKGKGKSAHDLLSDPRLSSQPVVITEEDEEFARHEDARLQIEADKRARSRLVASLPGDEESRAAKRKEMYAP
ncbi:unnamed protein product [Protopolystoma xenopodis]|uniref:Uncharacterized protein n=1 Tax=Protopolystoma xenopodis TaxID=117903 RepID=A0A448XM06_9PLAT|nr:unnamed protein product [Protopolystoma xenopodis]